MQTLHLYYHSSIIWLSHKSHCSSLSRWPTFLFFFVRVIFLHYLQLRFCVLFFFFFFLDFPAIYKLWNSPRFYDINVPAAWSTNIPRKNTLRLDALLTIFENVLLTNGCSNPSSALTLFLTFPQNFFLLVSFRVLRAFPTCQDNFGEVRVSKGSRRCEIRRILCRVSFSFPELGKILQKYISQKRNKKRRCNVFRELYFKYREELQTENISRHKRYI